MEGYQINAFSFGDWVTVLAGNYVGFQGTVIDPALDSDVLPPPRPGYYWIRIILHNQLVPVHVAQDDIAAAGEKFEASPVHRPLRLDDGGQGVPGIHVSVNS